MTTPTPQEQIDEEWRQYLLGIHPGLARGRRWFTRFPSSPRCNSCKAPFHGVGGLVFRHLGFAPWEKNPRVCKACVTQMSKFGAAGADIELSMMFADVRGSTQLAESTSDREFSALMNRFYETASAVLIEHDALIDKFVGDAVIGLFVPLLTGEAHAARAVTAAQDLLRATYGDAPGSQPWVPVGVGVHTGVARVGLFGRMGSVMDFTALGDNVNTTARLASSAGAGEILVSDAAAAAAHLEPGLEHRELTLKGKAGVVGATVIRVAPPLTV